MTQAQAAVAINAILGEASEPTRTQSSFDELTQATFGTLPYFEKGDSC
jgi:hypothetical protein